MATAAALQQTYDFSKVKDRRTALLSRSEALKTERTTWRTHWSDISRYLMPRSGRFFIGDRNRTGEERYNRIYDNTGTAALRTLGAGMMAGASNPARPWFKLTTADPELGEEYPVRVWLDDVVLRMQRVFAGSNTYRAMHQMYEELGAFGTSVSILLPDFENVIHHYPVVCGEYCLQQNYQGTITAMYREFEKSVGETVKEFGIENCSTTVQHQWASRQHENRVYILHVIEPRADQERDPHSKRPEHMPFKSCYLERGNENEGMLRESGFKRFPVLAPRWNVAGGDVYGHGPGMEALGDIRMLQQEQLRKAQGIDYMVRPPLQVPTQFTKRESELFPGGLNYADPGTLLPHDQQTAHAGVRAAFEVRLDLSHLLEDILDVRGRIRSSFYADLFLMLTNMDRTKMTAYEVAERHEEKLLALGPVLGRLENEMLKPTIDNTFDIMVDADLIPPAPPELEGQELTVEFVSILAQAQRAVGSNAVDRFMGGVMEVAAGQQAAGRDPDVLDKVDLDKWVDKTGEMLGVPTDLVVDQQDADALRQARAAAEAEQAQAELEQTQAAAAKDMSGVKTDERNVVADAISSGTAQQEALPV